MAGMRSYESTAAPYRFRIWANGVETHQADATIDGPEELWHEASTSACEMVRNMSGRVQPGLDWRFEVTDHAGTVVSLFSFRAEMLP
jgi:hypothetical protein